MKTFARLLLSTFAFLSAGFGLLHRVRIRTPRVALLTLPKLLAGAVAPAMGVLGLAAAGIGVVARAPLTVLAGMFGAWSAIRYVAGVVAAAGDFDAAFGSDWRDRLPAEAAARLQPGRWTWRLPLAPEPVWQRDVPFYTFPESERQLLCDVWQPPPAIKPSGLAFVYLHGSAWHFLDKDFGTRTFFSHLAGQGHVVMDVAYRLCPDTDWRGMLDDVQHAVAWIKANSAQYGVNPDRIVLGGGSAGGHLALLAAYSAGNAGMATADLEGRDLTVCGVVSFYGPADLELAAERQTAGSILGRLVGAGQRVDRRFGERLEKAAGVKIQRPSHWNENLSAAENIMDSLLGGRPADRPEVFRLASPVNHVTPASPPTLLLHGSHDSLVVVEDARRLARRLQAENVPVVFAEYPQSEHAFDIVLPRLSPPAQASLYEIERFLAILAAGNFTLPARTPDKLAVIASA